MGIGALETRMGIAVLGATTGSGTTHDNDAAPQQAQIDATNAPQHPDTGLPEALLRRLTGTLTLNFAGISNEDIVFRIGSTLATASNAGDFGSGGFSGGVRTAPALLCIPTGRRFAPSRAICT